MWIPNPTNAGRLAQTLFEIPQMDFNLTLTLPRTRTRTRKHRLRRRVERERDILKKLYPLSARFESDLLEYTTREGTSTPIQARYRPRTD